MRVAAKFGMEGGARNPRVPTIRMGQIYALYFVLGAAASDSKYAHCPLLTGFSIVLCAKNFTARDITVCLKLIRKVSHVSW